MACKAESLAAMWARLRQKLDVDPPTSLHDTTYLGCQQFDIEPPERFISEQSRVIESIFAKPADRASLVDEPSDSS